MSATRSSSVCFRGVEPPFLCLMSFLWHILRSRKAIPQISRRPGFNMTSAILHDRVAVITGGASGIGRAAALLLARHGARVFVGDLAPLPENAGPFAELGIAERRCDVRREEDLRRLIDEAAGAGRLDILVNNAGIVLPK